MISQFQNSRRRLLLAGALAPTGLLVACGGGEDDAPAAAPTGFTVEPAESGVIARWNAEPGLTYWVFSAAAASITRDDFNRFGEARITQPAVSPQFIPGLVNGRTYSFLVNATRSGSPAGPATQSLSAVPRSAGSTWLVGSALPQDLNALAFTFSNYVAVGNAGAVATRPVTVDGTWTARSAGVTANLNGVGGVQTLVAVGDGGTILTAPANGETWTAQTSGVTTRLNDIVLAPGVFVAVGDGGTVLLSSNGTAWGPVTSGTSQNLVGVAFTNGVLIALGGNGTLLTSIDGGATWTARSTGTTATLRHATLCSFASGALYVAVGDNGAVVTSPDLATWTVRNAGSTQNLRRIAFGSRALAVGAGGTALLTDNGISWTPATTGTTSELRALLRGAFNEYVAVGSAGANLLSR